ncbi:GntR family transcriptional regulator [Streptomyces sp. NBC_00885]|uniref:GntR family transcriptional regulator n=1 Tax=Streptomyces sp. NBC_00885 TaxID=2975857 RepID=UPI003864D045|nr:GntR family transcriptional regulator [Streptomyces sp. NBC_00885]
MEGPKYLKIADDLAEEIRTGALGPGELVPSETALMERYGVSSGTVRRAMAELRTRGTIETRHGAGSFVRSALLEGSVPLSPDLLNQLREKHGLTREGFKRAMQSAELSITEADSGEYALTYRIPLS